MGKIIVRPSACVVHCAQAYHDVVFKCFCCCCALTMLPVKRSNQRTESMTWFDHQEKLNLYLFEAKV